MIDMVFVRDLIVVVLVNVSTRNTSGKTGPSKNAVSVGAAGKTLSDRLSETLINESRDNGNEAMATYLKERSIGYKINVSDRHVHAIGVFDRVV